ncbi:MAG TPA: branched-chain amino acid ABC transporter ATP-binding protein/permease [Thermodesulfobacteriota bacterium]|nr:branched-chain amino acid ABC transporter ATP-binding protein/permease [Thermodesulfobacteriota bacterium]
MNTRTKSLLVPAALAVVVLIFPRLVTSNYWMNLINLAISFSIACLGLNIVLGYAGQLSLAQAAFWGVGAYTSAILTTQLGLPVWAGMFAAFFVAAFFGILLGIPTLKLSGHYLAMATIGFGVILQLILVNAIWLTNGSDGIPKIPSPWIGSLELKDPGTIFYVAAVALVLLTWGAIHLKDSRMGRAFMAIRENEMAAGTAGVDTTYYKIMAFSLSAGYAGFGGWLFAHSGSHYISPDTFSFEQSVIMLVMAVLGGNGSAIGSIVGAILLTLLPEVLRFLKDSYMMVYAAGIILIMIFMPSGIAGLVKNLPVSARLREWWRDGSTAARRVAAATSTLKSPDAALPATFSNCSGSNEVLLTVKGLAKHFGALRAVDGVDMEVRRGMIHAVIGPNGSGKTTILNMLSGLYVPTAGEILLEGKAISGQKSHHITSQGMARTFQNIRLFGELSVLENVLIGQHYHTRSGLLTSVLQPPSQKAEEASMRKKALEMLAFVGLKGKEFAQANSLPYGQQRLLELARALASDPKLLLLDEPAAGLNAAETDALVELLFQICDRGITILLVEHDMSLVMNVSDHITVLNFGKKIAEGSAEEVEHNQEVIDAYLGTEVSNA